MSTAGAKKTRALEDYLDLLQILSEEGLEAVVIGGLAVNAYGRLIDEQVLSSDLDLYASRARLEQIMRFVERRGVKITKRPKVRAIPVAFFEWNGKEVNVLTSAPGLPDPDREAQVARAFERPGVSILIGDPYDILRNKLAVNRPKDRPHAEVLKRFLENEIVRGFAQEGGLPRERIGPAQRYLDVTREKVLPEGLAARLIPLAQTAVDFRVLVAHVPSRELAEQLIERGTASQKPELLQELREILKKRRFPGKRALAAPTV